MPNFAVSPKYPGVYEINAICVPREPSRAEKPFHEKGGYPIFKDHADDRFIIAGYGLMGYDVPGVRQWKQLTTQNYADICEIHYVHESYRDIKFIKLRQIEVSFTNQL